MLEGPGRTDALVGNPEDLGPAGMLPGEEPSPSTSNVPGSA